MLTPLRVVAFGSGEGLGMSPHRSVPCGGANQSGLSYEQAALRPRLPEPVEVLSQLAVAGAKAAQEQISQVQAREQERQVA